MKKQSILLIPIALLATTIIPVNAEAEKVSYRSDQNQALRLDLGFDQQRAQVKSKQASRAAGLQSKIKKQLGSKKYAGSYINEQGELVVRVVGQYAGATYSGAVTQTAQYTEEQLKNYQQQIHANYTPDGSLKGSYLDPRNNTLVLIVDKTKAHKVKEIVDLQNIDNNAITIIHSAEEPKPLLQNILIQKMQPSLFQQQLGGVVVDAGNVSNVKEKNKDKSHNKQVKSPGKKTKVPEKKKHTKMRTEAKKYFGGDRYFIDDQFACSIAFSVTNKKTNQEGFLTAGHCGSLGAKATSSTSDETLGTFQESSFPSDDMAWVATTKQWQGQPAVNQYNSKTVPIQGAEQMPVGSYICRSGATTGWHCGYIEGEDQIVYYPQGAVGELVRTSVCAEPGDSGGAWVTGNQAQGITSGGSGDCKEGGTTYFQPISEPLQKYQLKINTVK